MQVAMMGKPLVDLCLMTEKVGCNIMVNIIMGK
jgi:hypothetical protein